MDMDVSLRHQEDRTSTHAYESTREAAMTAFAKSWRRREGVVETARAKMTDHEAAGRIDRSSAVALANVDRIACISTTPYERIPS